MFAMPRFYLCIALVASLTACAHSPQQQGDQPAIPANLRQPCPDPSLPADGTGAAVLRWSIGMVQAYRECQAKHRALVGAWPV